MKLLNNTSIALLFLLFSCSFSTIKIENFNSEVWKSDRNACLDKRRALADLLIINKDKLKEVDDDAIADLLGIPDRNRQYARGRKDYIYFIEKGSQCGNLPEKEGERLIIEFDALGGVRLIRISNFD